MRDHTKVRAFELADEVAVMIYGVTAKFPREVIYGLDWFLQLSFPNSLQPTVYTPKFGTCD
jgi:hypothetical protein